MRKAAAVLSIACMMAVSIPRMPAFAQEAPQLATMLLEQNNTAGILGTWTLMFPDNTQQTGSGPVASFSDLAPGNYTLFAEAPQGANTTIRRYIGTSLMDTVSRGQITFVIAAGESVKLSIHYTFIRVGTVAVHSDPAGVAFQMTGPNGMNVMGTTPSSYDSVPEGQYAVQYNTLPGCVQPPRQSLMLVESSRVSFDVTLSCKAADKVREREKEPEEEAFVTVTIDGLEVTMRDVPQSSWYANFVFRAAKLNIISGYRDKDGVPTGEFGPERSVTRAELAKMAQAVAGLRFDDTSAESENRRARGTWAEKFIAYAEQHGWMIFQDTEVDPEQPATRAEVVVTILQALDVPLRWQRGGMFVDVTPRTTYASAIETAAGDGIIGGYVDENDELTGAFGPRDPVTRAQIAKIVVSAIDTYRIEPDTTPDFR